MFFLPLLDHFLFYFSALDFGFSFPFYMSNYFLCPLLRRKKTQWDRLLKLEVTHDELTPTRIISAVFSFILISNLVRILLAPEQISPRIMAKNYVYFDLETIHSANDVGGWNNKGDMRMSVGVTYSSKSNGYIVYPEHKVEDLLKELTSADLVIGFNHINFDYPVLEGYHPFSLADQCISLD